MSELLEKKIIAYFHDPPWKAWAIAGHIKGGHEEQAIELLNQLGININNIPAEVRAADKLSSTIDRWLIGNLYSDNKGGIKINQIMFKLNIFSPDKRFKIYSNVTDSGINAYKSDLINVVNNEKKELKYSLIYFLAPLLWYNKFPNTPPLADTRVSTHTIFDHSTATSAMLNIIECKEGELDFKGSIAVIEFPSIQEFISISRKTRDLWASSWLSSVLLWKSIENFVEKYGPDIVLRPELSLNHFFISWLYNKSLNNKHKIKEYAEKYAGLKGDPRISMMSEKVILLLPEDNVNEVKNKLKENFYKAWKDIAEEVLGEWKEHDYVKKAIDYPPIEPVINVLSVKDVFSEYSSKLGLTKVKCEEGTFPLEYSLFFEYLYKRALNYNKVKYSYGSLISDFIYKITQHGDYKICTVCGILPSILYYYSDDKIGDKETDSTDDRLCPYCTLKRELRRDKLLNVMKKLGISIVGLPYTFPSTSELSMANYTYHYLQKVKQNILEDTSENTLEIYIDNTFKNPTISENYCRCYSGNKSSCKAIVDEDLLKKYGNLYYAIIKADGDYMGKGFWRGILPADNNNYLSISMYITIVANYLKEIGADKQVVHNLIETSKQVEDKIMQIRRKLDATQQYYDQIPLTLAYAYTLTRSLTIQAVIDNKILEKHFAVPIYLGGDDILALSPIKFKDRYTVLDASLDTRRAYWRYADNAKNDFDGFKSYNNLVVDSLRAYGRSYSVFIAHYKDPLPLSISISNYLLELKDNVDGKDVIFISSGRGISDHNYSILKFSSNNEFNDNQVKLVEEILNLMEDKKVSNSLIYDVLDIEKYKCESTVFKRLAYKVIDRNSLSKNTGDILYNKLKDIIGNYVCSGEACKDKEVFLSLIAAVSYLR